jgi:hypothetical protein
MKIKSLLILGIAFLLISCGDDESTSLSLNFEGLEDLGSDYVYEGWLIIEGSPVTSGRFSVDSNGNPSKSDFELSQEDVDNASTFVLTIEPAVGDDPAPSDVHVLAGDFSGSSASLSLDHGAAIGNNFASSDGSFILATPTDEDMSNEDSGIWFLDNSSGSPEAGLTLPALPNGWVYEGWAVIDGEPVSTGTFSSTSGEDSMSIFSGTQPGPPFPGEDFLVNAPSGLSFPTSLFGGAGVISIEPVPDNSAAPFTLKPLIGQIDENAQVHSVITMDRNLVFPTGTASR